MAFRGGNNTWGDTSAFNQQLERVRIHKALILASHPINLDSEVQFCI